MSVPTFLEARAAFKNVIGDSFNDQTLNSLIASLANEARGIRFADLVISLPPMSMENGVIRIDTGRKSRNNTGEFWGQGASGSIQKGTSGLIYKKITFPIDSELEESVKEVFLEAWIQTVMGLDKKYGENISQIRNIYRDISIVRGWEKKQQCILYITMDFNPLKITDYLFSFESPTLTDVKPQLTELGKILQHFDKHYNFRHRDFHQGNIMFDEEKSVRLIDFGRSCLTFDWTTGSRQAIFGMPKYGGVIPEELMAINESPCFSLDLLTLIASFIEYYKDEMSESLFNFLNTVVTGEGGKNLFSYLKKLKEKDGAAFWLTYPDKFQLWSESMIGELLTCPVITPTAFLAFLKTVRNVKTVRNKGNKGSKGSKGSKKNKTAKT